MNQQTFLQQVPHFPEDDESIESYAKGLVTGVMSYATPNVVGALLARIRRDRERWPEATYLECAMCSASEAFVISKQDPSTGYCFAEKREWTLAAKNYWPCSGCGTEYTTAENECSNGCCMARKVPDDDSNLEFHR